MRAAFSSDPETQQKLAVGVPILAVIVSLIIIVPAWGRNAELTAQLGRDRAELAALRSAAPPELSGTEPAADPSPEEAAVFQTEVRSMAAKAGCALAGYDLLQTQAADAAKESTTGQSGDSSAAAAGLRAQRVKVDVTGTYQQIRSLLWQIAHARRLYVINELVISLEKRTGAAVEPLSATIGIERYVASIPASAGTATGGANPNTSPSGKDRVQK